MVIAPGRFPECGWEHSAGPSMGTQHGYTDHSSGHVGHSARYRLSMSTQTQDTVHDPYSRQITLTKTSIYLSSIGKTYRNSYREKYVGFGSIFFPIYSL